MTGFVYFAENAAGDQIKIGFSSRHPDERLQQTSLDIWEYLQGLLEKTITERKGQQERHTRQ